jgi:tRNA(Ile)-lysidine synthase
MAPVRQEDGVCYIRPLLCVDRGEIEQYLADLEQPYCTDSTNADESYSRNRIRKSILPQLAEVNAQAVRHMNRCAESVSGAYDFLHGYAEKCYREIVAKEQDCFCLHTEELFGMHPAVRQEVLRILLFEAAGSRKDIAAVHVDELEELMTLQSGRRISLPYGLTAFTEYNTLYVCREDSELTEEAAVEEFFVTPELLSTGAGKSLSRGESGWFTLWQDENGGILRARIWNTSSPLEEITKKAYTKQFDYDMIKDGFVVRNRRQGDYFVLNSEGGRKKLSDYMINEKIPARLRGRIPLLARDNEVIWLIGWRIGANCKVTKDTARILEIQYNGGWSDGLCSET